MKYSLATLTATLAVFFSAPLFAQPADEEQEQEQWYQVELIVFSRTENTEPGGETWPEEPALKYPEHVVELKPAGSSEVALEDWLADIDKPLPSSGKLFEPEALAGTSAAIVTNEVIEPDTRPEQVVADSGSDQQPDTVLELPPATDPLFIQLPQQPFTLLEDDQLQLTAMAKRIAQQHDLQPLFHGAWRQPIAARDVAESILIRGGTQYDEHYELEGSISLGRERYLHINTDLWISTFASDTNRDHYFWPILPQAPTPANAELRIRPIDNTFSIENGFGTPASPTLLSPSTSGYDNFFSGATSSNYFVERTVALRQQRRMRSNELHYIDHPLLGVVIKIIPYEFPDMESAEDKQFNQQPESTTDATDTADTADTNNIIDPQ